MTSSFHAGRKCRGMPERRRWAACLRNTLTIILSGLLLCGCSRKSGSSLGEAANLVQSGTDTRWRDGDVLHVTRRNDASLKGVTLSVKLPTGQTQTITAETATLSLEPQTPGQVLIFLHNARMQIGSQTTNLGECPVSLKL